MIRGVGEVQSQCGLTSNAKTRASAQAGIYTLGLFAETTTVNKLATVVLYNDLSAHIALAPSLHIEPTNSDSTVK